MPTSRRGQERPAGVAFKNRDKLTSSFKRAGDADATGAVWGVTSPASPPETPASFEDARSETSRDEPPPLREHGHERRQYEDDRRRKER